MHGQQWAAAVGQKRPDPDSGNLGEAACYRPTCQMNRTPVVSAVYFNNLLFGRLRSSFF